jgi:C4-dicarboxylate-binding protein DctP
VTARLVLLLWLLGTGLALAGPAPSHVDVLFVDSPASSYAQAAATFKTRVEKETHGGLHVSVHAGGRWHDQTLDELAIIHDVIENKVSMAMITVSPLANYNEQLELLDIPFLFKSYEQVDKVLDGPIGARLLGGLEQKGLVGLSFLDGGFRIYSSREPIHSLRDMVGKRVRVMQNRTYINLVKAFSATPVPSAVANIYEMAERGYIDAADRSYPTYWDFKLYDVQKYIIETNHAYSVKIFLINKKFFDGLPSALQQAVRHAAQTASLAQRVAFRGQVEQVKREAASRGVTITVLSPQARQAFVEASRPVVEQVSRLVGADLVSQVRRIH